MSRPTFRYDFTLLSRALLPDLLFSDLLSGFRYLQFEVSPALEPTCPISSIQRIMHISIVRSRDAWRVSFMLFPGYMSHAVVVLKVPFPT